MKEPSSTGKNVYVVGCETEEDWIYIHDALEHDDWQVDDEVPTEHCDCVNDKKLGHTRGKFLLTDAEAEMLKQHPKVEYIHYDNSEYNEYFQIPEEDVLFEVDYGQRFNWRWENNVLIERSNNTGNNFKQINDPFQQNRSGWNIVRPAAKRDIWHYIHERNGYPNDDSSYASLSARCARTTTGEDVDLIAVDSGTWHAHPEFINDMPGVEYPRGYKGGNPLNSTGRSAVLDLILHGPYYIDPDWFDADSDNKLTTRWDGTIIPTEYWAKRWWNDSNNRSAAFSSVAEISIGDYTQTGACGDIYGHGLSSSHGTSVASQMYGRTHGWAYNANKWSVRTTDNTLGYDDLFDAITIFHENKPINAKHGNRNPTVCNHSWGLVSTEMNSTANNRSGYTWYRPASSFTTYTGDAWSVSSSGSHYSAVNPSSTNTSNTKPKWFRYLGYYGANWGFPVEMRSNSDLTSARNCVNAGVIFVIAPGNSNQKMVYSNHEDYNNHYSVDSDSTKSFSGNTFTSSNRSFYRSTNRIGYPGQAGRYYDSSSGHYRYKSIIVGALQDTWGIEDGVYKEHKTSYSNMGEVVDVYCAAHHTMAATSSTGSGYVRADTPNFYRANTVGVKTEVTSGNISHFRAYTNTYTSQGGDANAHPEYGLSNSNQWIDVLGNAGNRNSDEYRSVGVHNSGMHLNRKEVVIWKPQTGHRFVTSGTLNYPSVQYTKISSSIRGVNAGIASLTPSPMVGNYAGISDYDCWGIDLPFDIEFCGITTNKIGVSKWGVLEIGGQGAHSNSSTYKNSLAHGIGPSYGQVAINHGIVSAYTGIRTEILGTSPNRQYWVRYASKVGAYQTSGDMDTAWEATFYENSNSTLDIQIDINTRLSEDAQTVSNDYYRDTFFSGTSSASPVACGIIGTKMEVNRTWNYSDVKDWITNKVGIQTSDEFFYGSEAASGSNTQEDSAWDNYTSLHGGKPIVMWNAPTDNDPPIEKNVQIDVGNNLRIDGGGNLNIKYD